MSTQQQITANQQNAEKSTGPVTPEGKATVAQNAFKHGLTSKRVVMPWESPEAFEKFRQYMLTEALIPEGEWETHCVERVIANYWRLSRIREMEVTLSQEAESMEEVLRIMERLLRYERQLNRENDIVFEQFDHLRKERFKQEFEEKQKAQEQQQRKQAVSNRIPELKAMMEPMHPSQNGFVLTELGLKSSFNGVTPVVKASTVPIHPLITSFQDQ